MKEQRESNFELLRIIAMFMIIGGHYFSHGVGLSDNTFSKVFFYSGIFANGNIGVAIFLIISGWFLCSSNFSYKKLFRLCGEILFYSYIAIFITLVLNAKSLTLESVVMALFPISSAWNWYAGNFVIAYAFTPYVRKTCFYLHNNPKEYRNFLLTGCISFIVLGFLTPTNHIVSDLVWMIFLFYVGDYIHLKSIEQSMQKNMRGGVHTVGETVSFCFLAYGR